MRFQCGYASFASEIDGCRDGGIYMFSARARTFFCFAMVPEMAEYAVSADPQCFS